jgi:hypothetical protein
LLFSGHAESLDDGSHFEEVEEEVEVDTEQEHTLEWNTTEDATVKFQFSDVPIEKINLLSGLVSWACRGSRQWKKERRLNGPQGTRTGCITALQRPFHQDGSLLIISGYREIDAIVSILEMTEMTGFKQA